MKVHITHELETDSAKVNVWCGLIQERVAGPSCFSEPTTTRALYLICWHCMQFPCDHLQLPSIKTAHCLTRATIGGITSS
jgi:hypothetical protein